MSGRKISFFKKVIISFLFLVIAGGGIVVYWGYKLVYQPNVKLDGKSVEYFYIPTGSTFDDVINSLTDKRVIVNRASFQRLAELKKYKNKVKPGRYRIRNNMNNNELVNMLRAGIQEPVMLAFNNIRTKEQLASRVGKKLEADSLQLLKILNSSEFAAKCGLKKETILTLFIPNTYEMYWNTSADEFIERMVSEYDNFWNEKRKAKAKEIGLSRTEVATLASIVQAEQNRFNDEKPVIAGLYLNRLKIGMPLQSDPTLIYALGNFNINRVLNGDKGIDSPYNTYRNIGLPPGPINLPEISSLDAVLNYRKNNYLYMCAKEDFSGRHNFAVTMEQHAVFARRFREALDKHNIKR
ncbi:MAG: endolytic transglycosylase MltG [Bacteroidetes bacterium]|nr:endolytic transglycosylase MltG [Bacteroidota bacterium]